MFMCHIGRGIGHSIINLKQSTGKEIEVDHGHDSILNYKDLDKEDDKEDDLDEEGNDDKDSEDGEDELGPKDREDAHYDEENDGFADC